MDTLQFILDYTGTANINNEYTVNIPKDCVLQINWFPDNDLIVNGRVYNTKNTAKIGDGKYLINLNAESVNLKELPVKYEDDDILIAGNIFINKQKKEYCEI